VVVFIYAINFPTRNIDASALPAMQIVMISLPFRQPKNVLQFCYEIGQFHNINYIITLFTSSAAFLIIEGYRKLGSSEKRWLNEAATRQLFPLLCSRLNP
jgi:hypothetical protein